MYCKHCGQQLSPGAHFCKNCGQPAWNEDNPREPTGDCPLQETRSGILLKRAAAGAAIVVCVFLIFLLLRSDPVANTKGIVFDRYGVLTVGEAADQNLKQVKWTSEKNPDGSYTVMVRGISPNWNNARLGIDFTYTEDSEYYWASAEQAYLNGDYYDDNMAITMVMAIIYGNDEMANTALIWSMVS